MRLRVKVKPGSSQEKVIEKTPGEVTVHLHARAHDGEANKALLAIIGKHFGVAKSTIKIVQGTKSREKVVEIIR